MPISIDGVLLGRERLDERAAQLVAELAAIEAVRAGEPLLLSLSNGLDHLALLFAAWQLRLQIVEVAPTSSDVLVQEALRRVGARVVAIDAERAARWLPADGSWRARALATGEGGVVLASVRDDRPPAGAPPLDGADLAALLERQPAAIFFTSGSTGTAKGVVLRWPRILAKGRAVLGFYGADATRSVFPILPLSHVYGLYLSLASLSAGVDLALAREGTPPSELHRQALDAGATALMCPPLLARVLLGSGRVDARLRERLRVLSMGGAATSPEQAALYREAFPSTRLVLSYGLVETYSTICCVDVSAQPDKLGSVGPPRWGARGEIRDPDSGDRLAAGQLGELCIAEPITDGYLGSGTSGPQFTPDGLLRTGDLAILDEDGYVFVRGRIKDVFKAGALTVDPAEIEEVLAAHPSVQDCGMYVDASRGIEVIFAAVVLCAGDATALLDELDRYCRAKLAPLLVPRRIFLVPTIPRSPLGKIQRAALRELAERRAD